MVLSCNISPWTRPGARARVYRTLGMQRMAPRIPHRFIGSKLARLTCSWVGPTVVAALARSAVWALGLKRSAYLSPDTAGYWSLSENLLLAYSGENAALLDTALLRPPGYPASLALFRLLGDSYAVAAFLQSLIGALIVYLTYRVTRHLAGAQPATIAAWWLALDPLVVVQSSVLLTETVFSALLLGAIAVLISSGSADQAIPVSRWMASGTLVSAATFVRPISLYLPVVVLVVCAVIALSSNRRRLLLGPLVLVVTFAVPVGSWYVHNHSLTGVATFSTIQGVNLALYRAVGAMIHEDDITLIEAREEMRRLVSSETTPGMNPAELAEVQTRVGAREILERPRGYAYSFARGVVYTLLGPGRADIRARFSNDWEPLSLPVTFVSVVSGAGMAAFSALGAWRLVRQRAWIWVWLLLLPIAYLLLVGSGQESEARFRVPLAPMLAVLAAIGLSSLRSNVRTSHPR